MGIRRAIVLGCALCLGAAACSAILDLQPPPPGQSSDGGGAHDSTMPGIDTGADTTAPDAPSDSPSDSPADSQSGDGPLADTGTGTGCTLVLDAALPDGATDAETLFDPMSQVIIDDAGDFSFQFFDTSALATTAANYGGGAFDGRYVYFVPSNTGMVTRYDTTMPFVKAAFSIFDTSTLGTQEVSFAGAVFDGRFVYFVPHFGHASAYPGLVVRFDTKANVPSFATSTSAWSIFDTSTLPVPDGGTTARGFASGVFDGRYVYLVPEHVGAQNVGRVARYDTAGTDGGTIPAGDAGDAGGLPYFSSAAQWATFDTATEDPSAIGFIGGVFDGRYVYLVPYVNGGGTNGGASGVVTRYDPQGNGGFLNGSNWSSYDLTQVGGSQGAGFFGGAFDGRYVYLVPFKSTLSLRFDTARGLGIGNAPSWDKKDLAAFVHLDSGTPAYAGAAFDGRFVYYVPSNSGFLVRFDTVGECWYAYDLTKINADATSFVGAIYDGRWLYLAPRGTLITRFDTKSPSWMPNLSAFHGSFY